MAKRRKKIDNKRGRPRKYEISYEKARELVRAECIPSKRAYDKWWLHNRPAFLPRRPDRVWPEGFKWNDWLGNNNKMPLQTTEYRDYESAKEFVNRLNLKNRDQWLEYCRSGKKPEDIPSRPDYQYKEWFTWRDWLGKDQANKINSYQKLKPILFIIKFSDRPANVFKIGVINWETQEFIEYCKNRRARVFRAYELDDEIVSPNMLNNIKIRLTPYQYGEPDEFIVQNVAQLSEYFDSRLMKIDLHHF